MSFTVPASGARTCTVRVGALRRTATVAGARQVRIGFRVARRARAGTWRLTVACAPLAAQRVHVTVRGGKRAPRTARGLVAGAIRITAVAPARPARTVAPRRPTAVATAPAGPQPMSEADALVRAQADWATYGPGYLAVFRNGQCTDWAAQKRPDIVEHATVRLWADHYMGRPDPGISWNGGAWDDMARAARLPVGTEPRAGAVAAFDPGTMGAGAETGHIAYVESVEPGDGTFTVSEMNAPLPWQVTYRTIPIDAIAQGGISFVY